MLCVRKRIIHVYNWSSLQYPYTLPFFQYWVRSTFSVCMYVSFSVRLQCTHGISRLEQKLKRIISFFKITIREISLKKSAKCRPEPWAAWAPGSCPPNSTTWSNPSWRLSKRHESEVNSFLFWFYIDSHFLNTKVLGEGVGWFVGKMKKKGMWVMGKEKIAS